MGLHEFHPLLVTNNTLSLFCFHLQISVDSLSWEFVVSTVDDNNIMEPPKDGVYVKGLHLEGAGWDKKNACLVEAKPMQLVSPIPTVHFKPVENKKKSGKGLFHFFHLTISYHQKEYIRTVTFTFVKGSGHYW